MAFENVGVVGNHILFYISLLWEVMGYIYLLFYWIGVFLQYLMNMSWLILVYIFTAIDYLVVTFLSLGHSVTVFMGIITVPPVLFLIGWKLMHGWKRGIIWLLAVRAFWHPYTSCSFAIMFVGMVAICQMCGCCRPRHRHAVTYASRPSGNTSHGNSSHGSNSHGSSMFADGSTTRRRRGSANAGNKDDPATTPRCCFCKAEVHTAPLLQDGKLKVQSAETLACGHQVHHDCKPHITSWTYSIECPACAAGHVAPFTGHTAAAPARTAGAGAGRAAAAAARG